MVEPGTVARPYARAILEHAAASGGLALWGELLSCAALVVQDARVAALIGNPRVRTEELLELVLQVCAAAGVETGAAEGAHQRALLQLLAHNGRLPLLPQIAAQFELLRADAERIAQVQVTSARDLTVEQSRRLEQALARRFGRRVRLQARVDAGLLGGAVVRYGDLVLDGSLRGRAERMAADVGGA